MNKKKILAMCLPIVVVLVRSQLAQATERTHQIDGVIEKLNGELISVRSDKGTFVFDRKESKMEIPKGAKEGDLVTVWYTVNMEKIAIRKTPRAGQQQPGQLDPNSQKIILDDRVFYSAENEKKPENSKKNES
jgi:hypothetical protein